ncbi:TnpV protein [Selenomonas artemidis]|uniref:TnpV protein n=1 Tax=Selenomonas artemidis TaxID=671224 RepID=UPI0023F06000|nr:TnpV protein [Selenomonas artemidis]
MTEEEILEKHYGQWGAMRRRYLYEVCPEEWQRMLVEETLDPYLMEIQETYAEQAETMAEALLAQEGVTEELKQKDSAEWTGRYNNVLAEVREILRYELMPPFVEEPEIKVEIEVRPNGRYLDPITAAYQEALDESLAERENE